ncbi:hypothetical protein SLE2022_109450 [Rubroshorea leprosula]
MSTKMEAKHGTPSVLARLMGLDELPSQQPVKEQGQKRQRVLSDDYLYRVASIGVWDKRSANENSGYVGFSNSVSASASGHGNTETCPYRTDYLLMVPRLKSNFEACPPHRKIVVSKPKPRKAENPAKFVPLSTSLDNSQFFGRKRKGLHSNEINSFSLVRPVSGFEGVENHAKEPDMMMFSSKNFSDVKSCYRPSICFSGRSYMAGEAKKQISVESQNVLDSGGRGRSRTLGVMLAMSDYKSKPESFDDRLGEQRLGNRICSNDKYMNLRSPLGISSKDVWKNKSARGLPTSRSIFTSTIRSLKTRTSHKTFHGNQHMTRTSRFAINWESPKSRKQTFSAKDGSKTRDSGFSFIESQGIPYLESVNKHLIDGKSAVQNKVKDSIEENNPSGQNPVVSKLSRHNVPSSNHATQEAWLMLKDQKNNTNNGDLSGQNFTVSKLSVSNNASGSTTSDVLADAENMVVTKSLGDHNNQHLESVDCIFVVKDDNGSTYIPETSSQQEDESIEFLEEGSISSHYSSTDHDSLVNSEAAYQPSPVSVLETLDDEISSGSEFYKGIDAGLHGVRLQLEILKSKSLEAESGPGLIVSSDDDSEEESLRGFKENGDPMRSCSVEESRDFSYMVDVLTEAGFCSRNHMAFEGWHSAECPISPTVFEILEKKYGEQTSWNWSERRLLFDLINSGLTEILHTCLGVPMQAKPLVSFRQSLGEIEEELWILLVNQEKEASKESQKLLGNDDGWLVLRNDIELISREIGDSLIDELAAEVVSQESFE